MDAHLTIRYDAEGDILFIDACQPHADQESDLIGDDVLGRFNAASGAVETVEIQWFFARLKRGEEIALPVGLGFAGTLSDVDAARAADERPQPPRRHAEVSA